MTQRNLMKNAIHFTKMHSLGNDFVVINTMKQTLSLTQALIIQLADRHQGIGFDQLLLIEPSTQADFYCRIFNADGSEAEQCGNGLRCIARLIHEDKLFPQSSFKIETKAGIFPVVIQDYDHMDVLINAPKLQEASVELRLKQIPDKIIVDILSLGNPHAITQVPSIDTIDVKRLGSEISTHPHFSHGINVGFMQILNSQHIRLRTYERGAGETHACGSNACAAAYIGITHGWLTSPVTVEFRYGKLLIKHDKIYNHIQMTGPAVRVFEGICGIQSISLY